MFGDGVTFELNWDVNAQTAVSDLNRVENKLDSVAVHADRAQDQMKKGFGGNLFSGFNQSLSNMGKGLNTAIGNVGRMTAGMSPLGGGLMSAGAAAGGAAIAVAAVGAALVAGAFAAAKMADALQDMADKLGVTTDFLQVQQGVLTLTTGSADMLEKALGKLDQTYGAALGGDQGAADKFAQLGISLTDAAGNAKTSEQIFNETTTALRGVENQSQRAAMAADIFGKAGKEMGGYLSRSAAEVKALEDQIKKYGVASASAIQASGKLGDGMDLMGQTIRAGMINAFAPLANALGNLAVKLMPVVGEAFKVLGGVIDLVSGYFSVIGDVIKVVWDLFVQGASYIGNLFPIFGKLGQWLNFTGEAGLSLRERWAITMGDMIAFAANMVGRVAGFFAGLSARIHNVIAGMKNALIDSGIGGMIGVTGRMEVVDARAVGARVSDGISGGGRELGNRFTSRYRGNGNGADAAEAVAPGAISPGGGSGGASAAASAAAQATNKYNEAVAKLNQTKEELNLTDEQRRVLDEMERAGLERNIALTGERADTIRRLVGELQGLEAQKKVNEAVTEYERVVRESTYSADQLVMVEARRRAGLSEDLTIQTEHTRAVEAAALAADRARKAVELRREAESQLNDMLAETRDLENELREIRAGEEGSYEFQLEMIEEERQAREDAIRAKYSDIETINRLIEANNRLAQAQKDVADADETDRKVEEANDKAEELADTLMDMWDDWRGTMKRVLGDFIKEMLMAIAKATILKNIMGDTKMGGGGGGGSGGSSMGAMIANVVMSAFGGGRAAGGPMSAGSSYMVTPGEKFSPAVDGYMLSQADIRAMKGGGGKNINMGGITFNVSGGGDRAQTLADLQQVENNFRNIVRDELARA